MSVNKLSFSLKSSFIILRYKIAVRKIIDNIINIFSKAVSDSYTLRLKDLYEF